MMLELAILHQSKLNDLYAKCIYQEKYKYFFSSVYADAIKIEDNTWVKHQYVSISPMGDINGYIAYNIDRVEESAKWLSIIGFNNNSIPFALDVRHAIYDIFLKFNFHKLSFTVTMGNPAEKAYDRFIKKYHGNIIGISHDAVKLYDGKYYDNKLYEILRSDFMKVYTKIDLPAEN